MQLELSTLLCSAPIHQTHLLTDRSPRPLLLLEGGIRGYTDSAGRAWSALDVASRYFRAGADKVSIGSDAVYAAEQWWAEKQKGEEGEGGERASSSSSISQISRQYGAQAVVVSVDPKRVHVTGRNDPRAKGHEDSVVGPLDEGRKGPGGELYAWYQVRRCRILVM